VIIPLSLISFQNDVVNLAGYGVMVGMPLCFIWGIYIRLYCMNRRRLQERMSKAIQIYQEITHSRRSIDSNGNNNEADDRVVCFDTEQNGCIPLLPNPLR
jgi:hypothetical protein